jgi:integrase
MLKTLIIENAKARNKQYKISDGDGLSLLVRPNGSKLWRFRYHFAGKEKMLSLGGFPSVSLKDARELTKRASETLESGIDPSQERKKEKAEKSIAANNTFGEIADELLATMKESGLAESTLDKNRWLLKDLASPLSPRPVTEIAAAEILVILKKVEKSGRRESARRLKSNISRVFRLAVATLRATNDPTYALKGSIAPPVTTHLPAITDEAKLGALMVSIDEYDGWPTLRAALLLTALTMIRSTEIRLMRRQEIIWPKAIWRIPGERMKMRQPHDVPLSKQALAVLRDIWSLSEGHELVLPSIRSLKKQLSENALNSALRRMGYAKDEMCGHGFRTSASTILNERFPEWGDVIEAALAHKDKNTVRRAYNRGTYLPQRIGLMQTWADLLDDFRKLPQTRNAA